MQQNNRGCLYLFESTEREKNRAHHMEKVEIKAEVVGKYEEEEEKEEDEDGGKKKKALTISGGAWSSSGRKKLVADGSGSGVSPRSCQAFKCTADLSEAKTYHRRHRVCEFHAKAPAVVVAGIQQRFCQQCSRFHELSEFDEAKRSCRRRLAGHNERRRKQQHSSADQSHHLQDSSVVKGSSGAHHYLKAGLVCEKVDESGRIKVAIQENAAAYKHFHLS